MTNTATASKRRSYEKPVLRPYGRLAALTRAFSRPTGMSDGVGVRKTGP